MHLLEYFHEDLVFFLDIDSKEELFEKMFEGFCNKKYVKESYLDAIKEREEIFPTGLKTESLGVAIPHTDSDHVNKESIGVGILAEPVVFQHMGMEGVDVEVNIVFMLAIKKPENQLNVLQVITGLIQNQEMVKQLSQCTTKQEVLEIIKNFTEIEVKLDL